MPELNNSDNNEFQEDVSMNPMYSTDDQDLNDQWDTYDKYSDFDEYEDEPLFEKTNKQKGLAKFR